MSEHGLAIPCSWTCRFGEESAYHDLDLLSVEDLDRSNLFIGNFKQVTYRCYRKCKVY